MPEIFGGQKFEISPRYYLSTLGFRELFEGIKGSADFFKGIKGSANPKRLKNTEIGELNHFFAYPSR